MKPTILAILALHFTAGSVLALDAHVEAVIRTVEAAKGKVEKTEDGQNLRLVDLAVPGAGPHDHRKDDPYDSAFTLTNFKATTDDDLKLLTTMTQLESLELGSLLLPDERLPAIKDFAFLKSLRLTPIKDPFTPETQAQIKSLLPKTELKFQ